MFKQLRSTMKHALRLLFYGAIGVVLTLLVVFVEYLDGRDDLEVWHRADLDQEFTVDSELGGFGEYLALEDRLFAQLDEHNIRVISLRNKANRLEELFMRLVENKQDGFKEMAGR